jgi:hypothetical protein
VAVDSAGVLHVITAASVAGNGRGPISGVYHLAYDGARWTKPTHISPGTVGARSVEQPSLAISEGNRLHAFWEDDFERLWYTSRIVDAPTLPARIVPPAPSPVIAAVPVAKEARSSSPPSGPPAPNLGNVRFDQESSPQETFYASVAVSVVVIAALVLVRSHIEKRS